MRKIESIIGLIFCWGVGLLQIGLLMFIAAGPFVEPESSPGRYAWIAVFSIPLSIVFGWVNLSGFAATWAGLKSPLPLGIAAALHSRRWPQFIKPLAVIWWTLIFLVGVWMAIMFEAIGYAKPVVTRHMQPPAPGPGSWFTLCLAFGLTFAGNTFLLQAISVFTRDERILRRIWRLRLLIDSIVVLIPATLAYYGHRL